MKKEFKYLTLFKRWTLENFPFIEADFDAITNYELICKVIEYINKMGVQFNDIVNNQEYINEWFNNLNVQDEINNKLDEMVESGELQEIFEQFYIQDYEQIDSLTLTDKFLYLFGNDIAYWKMTDQRSDSTAYSVGDYIKDKNSNNIYVCSQAGTTASTYPTFNTSSITDGTCIWTYVSAPTNWEENHHYYVNNSVNIKNLSYVCIYEHTSSNQDGYNIKIKNNALYKRVNNNTLSNYPSLLLTMGYDNLNKVRYEGMNVPKSAIEVSNDGMNFNIIDTPMLIPGQDFSPYFYNGKYYILTFTKQQFNDFGLIITQNFKDYIKCELDLNISDETHPHVWFGQWFEDTINSKLYIVYSASDLDNPTITNNDTEYPNLRLWKVEVTDLDNLQFGTPTPINLSDNSRFDVFINIRNNTYYLFTRRYVDATDRSHEGYVEIWSSTDLENWTIVTSRIPALNNSGYEAMSIVEIEKNKYYMYVSKNLNTDFNRVWRIESNDLISWSNRVPIEASSLNLNEFGTVIKITNQDALSYLYNYMNTNNNSRYLIKSSNYLKLVYDKSLVWRNLNFTTHVLNILDAEDIIYVSAVNDTNIIISTIACSHDLPHRFFIKTLAGSQYITIKSDGNIFLPHSMSEIIMQQDKIYEFVYDPTISKYTIVSPAKETFVTSVPRAINLNELATDGVISNLQLENNCIYSVNINTTLTINAFSFKNNIPGEFKVAFTLAGNGSTHTTKLIMNGTSSVLITQYGTSSSLELTSTNNSNKYVEFGRYFGTGALHLKGL